MNTAFPDQMLCDSPGEGTGACSLRRLSIIHQPPKAARLSTARPPTALPAMAATGSIEDAPETWDAVDGAVDVVVEGEDIVDDIMEFDMKIGDVPGGVGAWNEVEKVVGLGVGVTGT